MAPENAQGFTPGQREEGEPGRLEEAAGLLHEWLKLDVFPSLKRRMGLDPEDEDDSKDDLEPLPPPLVTPREGSSLTSKLAFLMALASLGAAVYFHVPMVQDAVLELWRGARGAQADSQRRAPPRDDLYDYEDPDDEDFDPDETEDLPELRNTSCPGPCIRHDNDTG
mgnify:FL=1